ncbi:MAG TPA: SurA N-terminal domain-containing protein, partial [Candidatus Kapabacteria bacterium]|nr:SurA N-terminal domain-containing protein [Candidatus Kapabacteria bacterium]
LDMRFRPQFIFCLLFVLSTTSIALSQPSITPKPAKKHKPDDTVGVVKGVLITYRDFHYQLKSVLHDHLSELKGDSVSGEELTKFVNIAWDKMVGDVIVEQEIKKRGLSISKEETIKRMIADPPELIKQSFTDSLGVLHSKELQAFLESPVQDSLRDKVVIYYETSFELADFLKKIAPKATTDAEKQKALDAWIAKEVAHTAIDDRRVAFGYY